MKTVQVVLCSVAVALSGVLLAFSIVNLVKKDA